MWEPDADADADDDADADEGPADVALPGAGARSMTVIPRVIVGPEWSDGESDDEESETLADSDEDEDEVPKRRPRYTRRLVDEIPDHLLPFVNPNRTVWEYVSSMIAMKLFEPSLYMSPEFFANPPPSKVIQATEMKLAQFPEDCEERRLVIKLLEEYKAAPCGGSKKWYPDQLETAIKDVFPPLLVGYGVNVNMILCHGLMVECFIAEARLAGLWKYGDDEVKEAIKGVYRTKKTYLSQIKLKSEAGIVYVGLYNLLLKTANSGAKTLAIIQAWSRVKRAISGFAPFRHELQHLLKTEFGVEDEEVMTCLTSFMSPDRVREIREGMMAMAEMEATPSMPIELRKISLSGAADVMGELPRRKIDAITTIINRRWRRMFGAVTSHIDHSPADRFSAGLGRTKRIRDDTEDPTTRSAKRGEIWDTYIRARTPEPTREEIMEARRSARSRVLGPSPGESSASVGAASGAIG